MGFEPTPPERLVPKTSALDHSAMLPATRSSGEPFLLFLTNLRVMSYAVLIVFEEYLLNYKYITAFHIHEKLSSRENATCWTILSINTFELTNDVNT